MVVIYASWFYLSGGLLYSLLSVFANWVCSPCVAHVDYLNTGVCQMFKKRVALCLSICVFTVVQARAGVLSESYIPKIDAMYASIVEQSRYGDITSQIISESGTGTNVAGEGQGAVYRAFSSNTKIGFSIDQQDLVGDAFPITYAYVARKYQLNPISRGSNISLSVTMSADLYAAPSFERRSSYVDGNVRIDPYSIIESGFYIDSAGHPLLGLSGNTFGPDFAADGSTLSSSNTYILPINVKSKATLLVVMEGYVESTGYIHANNSLDFNHFETEPGAQWEINGATLVADASGKIMANLIPASVSSVEEPATLALMSIGLVFASIRRIRGDGRLSSFACDGWASSNS